MSFCVALLFCAESFPKAFIYQELPGKRIDELCNTWYNKEKSILPVQKKHRSFGAGRRNERGAMTLQQWVRRCLWLGTVLIILLTFPGIPAAKASSASFPLYQDYIYYSVTPRNEVTINSARASITEAVLLLPPQEERRASKKVNRITCFMLFFIISAGFTGTFVFY